MDQVFSRHAFGFLFPRNFLRGNSCARLDNFMHGHYAGLLARKGYSAYPFTAPNVRRVEELRKNAVRFFGYSMTRFFSPARTRSSVVRRIVAFNAEVPTA